MTETDRQVSRYDAAVLLLPGSLRERARELARADRAAAEELRIRAGRPLAALLPWGEAELGKEKVTRRELELLVELATGASVHAARRELQNGYISCRGGCRVGLCGSVYLANGETAGFSAYSSAAIRIARERRGIAAGIAPKLFDGRRLRSTLIIAPPGGGKTTLLRELTRLASTPDADRPGLRVSLCDERGEVAAMREGVPELDVGPMTDVLDGCPKAAAVMSVLRSMNPQVIALDEITAPEDVTAVERARNCGVALLATAHAGDVDDLGRRPLYRDMLSGGVFERFVVIRKTAAGGRSFQVLEGGGGTC